MAVAPPVPADEQGITSQGADRRPACISRAFHTAGSSRPAGTGILAAVQQRHLCPRPFP